ncbi:hypothetical protein TBR22_A14680 [Luteitalea sp. TBR-22]|uniref:hypothetical protein n=1 Tax=Luteitalea sp. TBR-22 TaxID=2802971 RepID=UPI001AF4CC01|nr:hypothetical protein [Luteitalea sp. TBR-22]BCS32258.1 hypothetical protein TBR22_A14680 [Luteitalea sp. TBR-22]
MPYIHDAIAVHFFPYGDLWNGVAVDLPVVVFGLTLDDVREQLGEALLEYFGAA